MLSLRNVLCAIDFSEHSRRALAHAAAVARWYRSHLTVLHVTAEPVDAHADGLPVLAPRGLSPEDRETLTLDVARFVQTVTTTDAPVEVRIGQGAPATEILAQADATRADLLVIGTHGRSGVGRLVLGSVSERVLRSARCPVLSVPRHAQDAGPATFTRILCPVDFSACSLRGLHYAASLATEAKAALTVLHVLTYDMAEVPDMYDTFIVDDRLSVAEFRKRCEVASRQRMEEAIAEVAPEATTVLMEGKPYREILRVAAEEGSDLIVIGVQGRGASDLFFLGSTTNHIVRQATCPVLTLRLTDAVP